MGGCAAREREEMAAGIGGEVPAVCSDAVFDNFIRRGKSEFFRTPEREGSDPAAKRHAH